MLQFCIAYSGVLCYSDREMTKKAADHPTTEPSGPHDQLSLGALALDLLDVTWRIAVPVVLLAGAGIFVDNKLGTGPLLTFVGVIAGFVAAVRLVKEQLLVAEHEDDLQQKEGNK